MPVNAACYPTIAAARGLVALYLLDDSLSLPAVAGETVVDSAGTYDGVVAYDFPGDQILSQADPIADCAPGKSFTFVTAYVNVASPGVVPLNTASEFTFFAWVERYSGSGGAGLDFSVCDRRTIPGGGQALFINGDDELSLAVYDNVGSPQVLEGTTLVTPGQRAFVAGTADGSTLTVYVDGQPAGSVAQTKSPTTGNRAFFIGADTVQPARSRGRIDNLGVCTAALTDAEIFALYRACQCARQKSRSQLVS